MATISTQFKGLVRFDVHKFQDSRFELHVKHTKGWKPFLVFTAGDVMRLFSKKQLIKRKR
jgi:hypothetical protein